MNFRLFRTAVSFPVRVPLESTSCIICNVRYFCVASRVFSDDSLLGSSHSGGCQLEGHGQKTMGHLMALRKGRLPKHCHRKVWQASFKAATKVKVPAAANMQVFKRIAKLHTCLETNKCKLSSKTTFLRRNCWLWTPVSAGMDNGGKGKNRVKWGRNEAAVRTRSFILVTLWN